MQNMYACVSNRGRKSVRERHTDTHTHRERKRARERHRHTYTHRERTHTRQITGHATSKRYIKNRDMSLQVSICSLLFLRL